MDIGNKRLKDRGRVNLQDVKLPCQHVLQWMLRVDLIFIYLIGCATAL